MNKKTQPTHNESEWEEKKNKIHSVREKGRLVTSSVLL